MVVIEHWDGRRLRDRLDDVLAVYKAAFLDVHEADPRRATADRRAAANRHLQQPDVRGTAALEPDGSLVGFGYGYKGRRGQWWHEVVIAALGPDRAARWLADCFEVVELHVLPGRQGHGLGRTLLRELLAGATERTTALSALETPGSRARRLYASEGYVPLLSDFTFPGNNVRFAILAKDLPRMDGTSDGTRR